MNPYDFVHIDWDRSPARRRPVWHHRLVGDEGKQLYAGQIEVDVLAEKPLFIADPRSTPSDPKRVAFSIQNKQGQFVIPGSSLKGVLRCLVETLGNGCLTLFDGHYEDDVDYSGGVPKEFQHCEDNTKLCIACRIFGMLKQGRRGVFLGKINIGDAVADADEVRKYKSIYTAMLMNPKPHHYTFYLNETEQFIAGRKYYFHHRQDAEILTTNGLITMGGQLANRYIQPLDRGTRFHFRIDFTNLEADEFAVLLLAVRLESGMRHKIGYGKPLGFGSVQFTPTRLTLVDYATRYSQPSSGGKTVLRGDELRDLLDRHIADFSQKYVSDQTMSDLRRIWRWPPDPGVDYYYPSKRDWFDTEDSIGKRIADTRNTPKQA